ncbi:hypothetical protein BZA77DRAFT_347266 [Pyronema omphalodes]|nr:hypothetical protein BZA77DRAFT_347266 [Pyronema omphalodes]
MIAQDISRTFLLIVCACAVALAQDNGPPDPVTDFCYIRGSSLHNYNQQVYIYGGSMAWQPNFANYSGPNDYLRITDVSKPFNKNQDVETYIKRIPLPDEVSRFTTSTMWPIAKDTLASFFGWHQVSHYAVDHNVSAITKVYPLNSKFSLDTTTNSWTVGQVKSIMNFTILHELDGAVLKLGSQMSAWVPSIRRGYYLGGFLHKDTPNLTWGDGSRGIPGGDSSMIMYDAASDTLKNSSIPFHNMDGQLVHLTTKDDEILINFGGNSPQLQKMTDFFIYSTKQEKWFSFRSPQNTSVPDIRQRFCAAVVSAPDNSSHQIFIYGGDKKDVIIPADDTVWVLSIPSFDWIKLPGIGNDLLTSAPDARREPVCLRVGKKFMMSWGGQLENGCYDYAHTMFLLDMTTGFWVNDFNPDDNYEVPQSVVDVIGGTKKGGATKLKPEDGFADPELEKLMSFNIGPGNGQTSDASGKHTAANTSTTGAIVGGVVGGIAGLAIIGGAVFYFLRKKQYDALAENGQSQIGYSPGPVEAPAEAWKEPGISPNEVTYPTECYPGSHPVELYPGDVRLGELEGVRSRNELPADHPIRR